MDPPLSPPPIPVSQLYQDKLVLPTHVNCTRKNMLYVEDLDEMRCLISQEVITDYRCRYDVASLLVESLNCYCCGKIYTYIELGMICSKLCRKSEVELQEVMVGQEAVIQLPFNWGEEPTVELAVIDK